MIAATKTPRKFSLTGDLITREGILPHHTVTVTDTTITSVEPAAGEPLPLGEQPFILPGFADLHNHGGAGYSFPTDSAEGCSAAALHHRAYGTTTLLASTVSATEEPLLAQLAKLADLCEEGVIDGIHAEGPFVNKSRCGAQDPAAIVAANGRFLQAMIEAARGHLVSVTFAPEAPRAPKLIDLCARHGVIASFGHTDADYIRTSAMVREATLAGATVTATHLFNAMPQIHHRAPGAAAALMTAAAHGDAVVELIADGVHLDDRTVAWVMDMLPTDQIVFVTDAMAAAGMDDGDYTLGALDVTVDKGVARLATKNGAPGAIAGGTSRLIDQLRRQIEAGRDPVAVVRAATNGHALVGRPDRGHIRVGAPADLVVCGADFYVKQTICRGVAYVPPDADV